MKVVIAVRVYTFLTYIEQSGIISKVSEARLYFVITICFIFINFLTECIYYIYLPTGFNKVGYGHFFLQGEKDKQGYRLQSKIEFKYKTVFMLYESEV